MRRFLLGWAAGIWWLQCQPVLPALTLCLYLSVVAGMLLCIPRQPVWLRHVTPMAAAALLGYVWAAMVAHQVLSTSLDPGLEQQPLLLTGTIEGLPQQNGMQWQFLLRIASAECDGKAVTHMPSLVSLGWRDVPGLTLLPGQRWQLPVKLKRPHGLANPHGFDYELYLVERHVRATGYVKPGKQVRQLPDGELGLFAHLHRWRDGLRTRLRQVLAGSPYAGVIEALVIGDQHGIRQVDSDLFRRTGVSHLVAISGLHVSMVAGLVMLLVSFLWRHSFFVSRWQLPLWLPAQKVAMPVGLLAAGIYVLLAGMGIPAQRALVMLAVATVALMSSRRIPASVVLLLAAAVVLLLDPWAILSAGFWLSFTAVACLVYAGSVTVEVAKEEGRWQRWWRRVRLATRLQLAVTLGLLPLSALLFGQVSVVGPLANVVAIPAVTWLIAPAALAGAMLPGTAGDLLLMFSHAVLDRLFIWLRWLGEGGYATLSLPAPPVWVLACGILGSLLLFVPNTYRFYRMRWAGLAGLLPLFLWHPASPGLGQARVTFLDIGQGMAVLVETASHRLLYDTGPGLVPGRDAGARVIVPFLHSHGIRSLDMLVVSHSDNDHIGGALSVMQALPVHRMATSLPTDHPLLQTAIPHEACREGQSWEWDGVRFDVLHPDRVTKAMKPNARSCVVRVQAGGHVILLTGDIEAAQERMLVETYGDALKADVLLVPHHGSRTSSTQGFITAVSPSLAVFQVGYRNRYHHPHPAVLARYQSMAITGIRSDQCGALLMEIGREYAPKWYCHRTATTHYWSLMFR